MENVNQFLQLSVFFIYVLRFFLDRFKANEPKRTGTDYEFIYFSKKKNVNYNNCHCKLHVFEL